MTEVRVAMYVPLDPRLLKSQPEPAAPPARCRDTKQRRTVCNEDTLSYLDALRAWGRGAVGQLKEIAGVQPKPPEPGQ